jgi:endonuclease VIII
MALVQHAVELRPVPEHAEIDPGAELAQDRLRVAETQPARTAALERPDGSSRDARSSSQRSLRESLSNPKHPGRPPESLRVHLPMMRSDRLSADYWRLIGAPTRRSLSAMPEGDTIYRTAEVLRRVLVGRHVTAARAQAGPGVRRVPDLAPLVGTTVGAVESRGKHLLIRFSDGHTLRTHLRMRGSWHRYRPGEPWRLSERRATVVLETAEAVAVAFDTPVAELLTDAELRRSKPLLELGPDLLGRGFDADEALGRLRARDAEELGSVLLDQRAVAGIGNVVKSEVAFMERLNPWAPVGWFSDEQLLGALATARRILRANTGGGARVTTGRQSRGQSLWVYRRTGRPCRRCGTLIQSARQGELARTTYWCARCQGSSASAT